MNVDPMLGELPPYPGKRPLASEKRRKPTEIVVEEEAPPEWDTEPRFYFLGGQRQEFFNVGALATALGRKAVTIRSWEDKGILPKSKYRTPPPKKGIAGKATLGRRLYTRAQIEAVLEAAKVTGVLDGSPNVDWKQFATLVWEAWRGVVEAPRQ